MDATFKAACCDGKVKIDDQKHAQLAARRQRRAKDTNAHAYRCKNCGGWHVGTTR